MKKNKPRYKKGRVKKALKRVTKQTGGAIAYDPTKGYKKGQTVDAGEGAIFKAKTDVKAGTAGLGNASRWERVEPTFQATAPVEPMQESPNNRTTIQDPQRVPTGTATTSDLVTQYPGLGNPPAGMVINPNYNPNQPLSTTNPAFIPSGVETPTQRTTLVNTMQGSPQQTTVIAAEEETEEDPYPLPEGLAPEVTYGNITLILNPNYDPTKPSTDQMGNNPIYVMKDGGFQTGEQTQLGSGVGAIDPTLTPTDPDEPVKAEDDTLNPEEAYLNYPIGYRTKGHLESSIDYTQAPPFPDPADPKYKDNYQQYLDDFEAHKAGPYAEFMKNPPLKTGSENNSNVDPNTDTDTNTGNEDTPTTEPERTQDTIVTRIGVSSDAPTGIDVESPEPLTEEQQAAITRDVTSVGEVAGVKSLSNAEVTRLTNLMNNENAAPYQRQLAQQRLNEVGLSTQVSQLGEAPTATAGTVTATGTQQKTALERAATLQGLFSKDAQGKNIASTYTADKADAASMTAAQGKLSEESTAIETRAAFEEANRVATATRARQDEQAALATDTAFTEDQRSQAQQVDFDSPVMIQRAAEAEAAQRKVITDDTIPEGEAAKIINIAGFDASQRRSVTGDAATGEAAEMLVVIGDIPPAISAAIVEDPASVSAEVDLEPVEVQAAIAALPTEALVSSQMENLLAGIEEGVTPVWARPAVDQVNSLMVARGLSVSTVGRDALFNAIIQTALPIAQSNAQALQQRASQNLSNEQQSNISEANLNAQRRLANLSNRQTAGSQTAQMAQQMATLQSQFSQDAVVATATQQQQIRIQNLANRQEQAKIQAQLDQQAASQNLGNEQQIELAELQYLNATEAENLNARQQELLAEYQAAADYQAKNAGFTQQMELANLSSEQQVRLSNLSAMNDAARDQMTADQQTELANLQSLVTTNVQSAKIAESMGIAKLSADQQTAIFNASTVAKIDLTKFSTEQQVELANSKFMQTSTLTDFSARQQSALQDATTLAQMDIQAADLATKTRISNAQNFLQMDVLNLNNNQQAAVINSQLDQQTRLSNQAAENARLQFNATSQNQVDQFMTAQANQMEQFNTSQFNAMQQFNAAEANRLSAIDAGNSLQASQAQAQLDTQISQFNTQIDSQREQWNAANAQAVEQSNINWRRQANTIDTAAENAANQQNVQNAFALTASEQAQYWQQLRDEANYLRQAYENEQTRKAQLYMTAIGNEAGAEEGRSTSSYLKTLVDNIV